MTDFILCDLSRDITLNKNGCWDLQTKEEVLNAVRCGWCQGKLPENWYTSSKRHERHGFCNIGCDRVFFTYISIKKPIFHPNDWTKNSYNPQCEKCKSFFTPRQIVKGRLLNKFGNKNYCVECEKIKNRKIIIEF